MALENGSHFERWVALILKDNNERSLTKIGHTRKMGHTFKNE